MNFTNLVRQHWAALRALLVLTVIVGLAYPVFIWLVVQIPGLRTRPTDRSSRSTESRWAAG